MVPTWLSSRMGMYEIEMNGVSVKTRVVDRADFVDTWIAKFKSQLQRQLVGIDIKIENNYPELLLLYAGSHSLIIQMKQLDSSIPESLKQFLSDQNICFLGVGMNEKVSHLNNWYDCRTRYQGKVLEFKTGVELGDLAARVLKKPDLARRGLAELGSEVGVDIGEYSSGSSNSTNWTAKVFSHEEVKCAISEAYVAYQIGNKLVDMTQNIPII